MQAILTRFGFRHLDEQQVGYHAVIATTFGWLDNPLRIFVLADHPIQCRCPEPGQSAGILGIDDLEIGYHAVIATTFGWLDNPLRIFVLADHPIQCRCPEPGQSAGILGIDDQGTDAQSHGITVGNATAVVDRYGWVDHLRIRAAVSCRVGWRLSIPERMRVTVALGKYPDELRERDPAAWRARKDPATISPSDGEASARVTLLRSPIPHQSAGCG